MFTETEELRSKAFQYFLAREYLQTLQECMKAITMSPSLAWCYYLMGLCYFRMGRFTYAYAYLKHFLNLPTPKSQEAKKRAEIVVKSILEKSKIKEGEYRSRHEQFPDFTSS